MFREHQRKMVTFPISAGEEVLPGTAGEQTEHLITFEAFYPK